MKTLRASFLVSSFVLAGACTAIGCGSNSDGTTVDGDSGKPVGDSASGDTARADTGSSIDSGSIDTSTSDSATTDSATTDSAKSDSGKTDTGSADTAVADSGTDTGVADSGTTDSVADSGATDSGPTDAADAADAADAPAPVATGTRIATGPVQLQGVTTDDWAVYFDSSGASLAVNAVSLAGGTAQTVDAATSGIILRGKGVFSWSGVPSGSSVGTLTAWTATAGAHALSTTSIASGGFTAISEDGNWMLYTDGAAADGSTAAMKLGRTDGTGTPTTIFPSVSTGDSSCRGRILTTTAGFVVVHCNSVTGDAGPSAPAQIDSVRTDGTIASLATNVVPFASTDLAGTKVMVLLASGTVELVPFAGGSATTVDTAGLLAGALSPDGGTVLYLSGANELKSSPTATVSPVILASGVQVLAGASPSLAHVMYSNAAKTAAGNYVDLDVIGTSGPSPTPLTLTTTGENAPFGTAFTTDERYAVYFTTIDTSSTSATSNSGTLMARAIGGGAATTIGAPNAWIALAATGSKIVFNDNYDAASVTVGTATQAGADLKSVDVSGTAPPNVIATNADASYFLSTAKGQVVYATYATPALTGIYVAPVP